MSYDYHVKAFKGRKWNDIDEMESEFQNKLHIFSEGDLILAKIEGARTNADMWSVIKIYITEDEDGVSCMYTS